MGKTSKITNIQLRLPENLKSHIRKFRGKRLMDGQPLTSDAKAILYLVERGLDREAVPA